MLWLAIAAVALVILVAIVTRGNARPAEDQAPKGGTGLPYRTASSLLKADERQFFDVLRQVAGSQFHVFPKVGLVHLLQIGAQGKEYYAARGRISQKTADFVLVTPDNLTPVLVIDLEKPSKQEQESKVEPIYRAAGLAYLPVPANQTWDVPKLSGFIGQALSQTTAAPARSRR